jgi:hypothetical protein
MFKIKLLRNLAPKKEGVEFEMEILDDGDDRMVCGFKMQAARGPIWFSGHFSRAKLFQWLISDPPSREMTATDLVDLSQWALNELAKRTERSMDPLIGRIVNPGRETMQ